MKQTSFKQASTSPHWTYAMSSETVTLSKNQIWHLVPPPRGVKIISYKWAFKLKLRVDDQIDRYKARLVAKGYDQTHGLDYFETFSLIVKPITIQVVLTIVIFQNWPIKQLVV